MNQQTREELVSAWIDGQLDAATAREVESQVAADPALRELAESLRDLSRQLRQLPPRSLKRDLTPAILLRVRDEAGSAPDEPVESRSVTRGNTQGATSGSHAGAGDERRARRRSKKGLWVSLAVAASLLGVAIWLPRGWQSADRGLMSRAGNPVAPASGVPAPASEGEKAAALPDGERVAESPEGGASKPGMEVQDRASDASGLMSKSAPSFDLDESRPDGRPPEGIAGKAPGGFGGGGGGRNEAGQSNAEGEAPGGVPANADPAMSGIVGQAATSDKSRRDSLAVGDPVPGLSERQSGDESDHAFASEEPGRMAMKSHQLESGEALAEENLAPPNAVAENPNQQSMSRTSSGDLDSQARQMARGGGLGDGPADKSGADPAPLAAPGSGDPTAPGSRGGQLEIVRIEFDASSASWNELAGQLDPQRIVLPEHSPAANEQDLVLFTGSEDDWLGLINRLAVAHPQARIRFLAEEARSAAAADASQALESKDAPGANSFLPQQSEATVPTVQFVGRFGLETANKLVLFQEQLAEPGQNQLGLLQDQLDQLGYQRRNPVYRFQQPAAAGDQGQTGLAIQAGENSVAESVPPSDQPRASLSEQADHLASQPAASGEAESMPGAAGMAGLAQLETARIPVQRLMIFVPAQQPAPAAPAPAGDRN